MSVADDLITAFEPWFTGPHESFEELERVNKAENPKAGTLETTSWTNVGLLTFEAVELDGSGGRPAPTPEMRRLGLTRGFHGIANTPNDRAYLLITTEAEKTYRFSMYVWIVSTAGLGIDLNVRDPSGAVVLFNSPDVNTLGQWVRIDLAVPATDTATYRYSPRSVSSAAEWYWTGVLIEEADTLNEYFDGSSSRDTTRWTGAAELSSSEMYAEGDPLRDYQRATGSMFAEVELYSEDTEDYEGWSILLDVNRCPREALPYLAQYVGERLPGGLTEEQERQWIRDAPNQVRGTVKSIVDAAQRYLTGGKTVTIIQRDGGPDKLTVVTYTDQTPNSAQVLGELDKVVPADITLTYVVSAGQIWSQVVATDADWNNTMAESPTWADLMAETPGGTYGG